KPRAMQFVTHATALIAVILLIMLLSLGTSALLVLLKRAWVAIFPVAWPGLTDTLFDHAAIVHDYPLALDLAVVGLAVALGALTGYTININTYSLHGMYRNRLIRAYLGASRREREPNAFTGFDPQDDLPMHALAARRPLFPILNLTLN